MSLEFWFMLPISILVATIAMASGVEGATFFAPILILGLGLPTDVAVGTGLITEVFGFASGLYAYRLKRLIDYRLGLTLLLATIPLALLGTWLSTRLDSSILKVILSFGLLAIGANFLRVPGHKSEDQPLSKSEDIALQGQQTCLTAATGEELCYRTCNAGEGRVMTGLGGLFMGMVGTGLGEMNSYYLLRRCRVPAKVAVATSVFIVAVTALTASAGHLLKFAQAGGDSLNVVFSLVIFTIPGVMLGGQIGSGIASRISQQVLERSLGFLFILVAVFMAGSVLSQTAWPQPQLMPGFTMSSKNRRRHCRQNNRQDAALC